MCSGNAPDLNLYVICTYLITCYYNFDIELPQLAIRANHIRATLGMCHGKRLQSKSLVSLFDNARCTYIHTYIYKDIMN